MGRIADLKSVIIYEYSDETEVKLAALRKKAGVTKIMPSNKFYKEAEKIKAQDTNHDKSKQKEKVATWHRPDVEEEHDEIHRAAKDLGVEGDVLKEKIKNSKAYSLNDKVWSRLENTDSYETDNMDKVKKLSKQYKRDYKSIEAAYKANKSVPTAMIAKKNGKYTLIGGNTRLMVARAMGITPKVVLADLDKD